MTADFEQWDEEFLPRQVAVSVGQLYSGSAPTVRAIELCAGPGCLTHVLAQLFSEVLYVEEWHDWDEWYPQASARLASLVNVSFVKKDILHDPWFFDLADCIVINGRYTAQEMETAIARSVKFLRPNGRLLITRLDYSTPENMLGHSASQVIAKAAAKGQLVVQGPLAVDPDSQEPTGVVCGLGSQEPVA